MNRRVFDPRKNRLAVSIAILVIASWVGDSIFASDYVLKEVAVIAHPHGLARCPRSFHDGRVAVLGTHGNLFILNPQVEATPSRRIDLFDVEDMAFFPQSNLLLCAGHDLVAVDLESNTFHLLNVSAINWGGKEPNCGRRCVLLQHLSS